MFNVERVTFVATVGWPTKGPVDALSHTDWASVLMDPTGVIIEHPNGAAVFVPFANIRWVSMFPPPPIIPEPEPSIEPVAELIKKKRGRPKKVQP